MFIIGFVCVHACVQCACIHCAHACACIVCARGCVCVCMHVVSKLVLDCVVSQNITFYVKVEPLFTVS